MRKPTIDRFMDKVDTSGGYGDIVNLAAKWGASKKLILDVVHRNRAYA